MKVPAGRVLAWTIDRGPWRGRAMTRVPAPAATLGTGAAGRCARPSRPEWPSEEARTMSSTVLRDFREADGPEINRLAVTAFEEFARNYSDWPALAAFYARMSDLSKSGEIVVAEISASIVGAVAYIPPRRRKAAYFDQAWPVIRSLVVDPKSRGLGVGRALTQECIARARRDGSPVIALHTSAIMTVALAMYLRMGFEWDHDAPAVYGVPYAVYIKRL